MFIFNINCLIAATYFWFIYCQAIECFEKNCYYFGSQGLWREAREFCEFHGDLATIHSKEENDFITNLGHEYAWIGLTGTSGDHRWVDGSALTYENFHVDGDFVAITNSHLRIEYKGLWWGWTDTARYSPVCETTTTDLPTFYTSGRAITYEAAKYYCRSTGGELASIRSAEENDFVYRHIVRTKNTQHCWIGLTLAGVDEFEWLDGSVVDFTYWENGHPVAKADRRTVATVNKWRSVTVVGNPKYTALCRRNGADEFTSGVPRPPTLQPSLSPTDESCSLGLEACKKFYQERLEVSLANKMYENCESKCVYDYDKVIDMRQGGFKYNKNGNCYDYVKKGGCFSRRTYLKAISVITSRLLKKEGC